jgi:phosphoglycerol geranylgeranyltransferase
LLHKTKYTKLIVLIDPDKYNPVLLEYINKCKVSYIFIGGSTLKKNNLDIVVKDIKQHTKIPVIIFPGDEKQISKNADGILILSLLSSLNPSYLITKVKQAALKIKQSSLKTIPTAYVLVDGGKESTTEKITKSKGLKSKKEILSTCVAAELMGKQLIYLEAGSGAKKTINPKIIMEVKEQTSLPIIIGGGINNTYKAKKILDSNPDYIVVGNALEQNPLFIFELSKLLKS